MNDLTVGIALGRLGTRGRAKVRVGDEWHLITVKSVTLNSVNEPTVLLEDLYRLLNAEEVEV